MTNLLARHPDDRDAQDAASAERREFAMFRKNPGWFGYELFLLRRS